MSHLKFLTASVLACSLAAATTAMAATQGTLGATSTGTTDISLTIPNQAQITGLADITLTPVTTAVLSTGFTTACVFANTPAPPGQYSVTATSGFGLGTVFRASNGPNFIVYTATWEDSVPLISPLLSGIPLPIQVGDPISQNCGGGTNAQFTISFSAPALQAAPPGVYLDTATLLVVPI